MSSKNTEWIEWAAKEKASETVAAALLLICETRPVHEVVAKLTLGEFERVVDIVRRSPDHFPSGTLAALKSRGAMLARRPAADDVSIDQEPRQRPVGTSPNMASERQAHLLRAAQCLFYAQFRMARVLKGVCWLSSQLAQPLFYAQL